VKTFIRVDSIYRLIEVAGETSKSKGFHDSPATFGDRIALIHSELSEALEEHRKGWAPSVTYFPQAHIRDARTGKPEGIPVELADTVIRIADMAYIYDIDLPRAIEEKLAYNATRPHMHGRKL
jgi:NTP pyrophosphatase (non-canonical NTP hydrolase)